MGIGNSLSSLGKSKASIRYYDKAIKINPEYSPAWHGKGKALGNLGRDEEAKKCFAKA